jgi:phenylacetate-CoA ligase
MTWTRSLKFSLRSLGRELVRNLWGRLFVYPALARNERSRDTLARYVARRAARVGVTLDGDPASLPRLAPDTPLLTKQDLRQHPERLLRPRRFGSLIRTTIKTSGTSGTPLTIVQSLGNMVREEGFVYRQLRWIGWRHGQPRAWIRGDIVCADHPRDGRYWCRDWVGNMLMMSSYHLSNDTIGAYIDALERFEPVVIHAYPSSIAALAAWLNARGRRSAMRCGPRSAWRRCRAGCWATRCRRPRWSSTWRSAFPPSPPISPTSSWSWRRAAPACACRWKRAPSRPPSWRY